MIERSSGMGKFSGKVVAITGAASGIGRALAVKLAKLGARLAIADVNESGLKETQMLCQTMGAEVVITILSVANRKAIDDWATATRNTFGKVNVIINNAGVSLSGTVDDMCYEDFEWLMNINFWGVVYGTKAFLPYLRESGDGQIVNVSSLFGLISMPTASAYNASKFAVRGFTESLIEELLIQGTSVNAICVHPGGIDTNIVSGGRVTANKEWGLSNPQQSANDFKRLARTSPDAAAEQIILAMLQHHRRLLIGIDAKLIDIIQRFMPVRYQTLVVKMMRKQLAAKQVNIHHEP